jgi:hypothetical protein
LLGKVRFLLLFQLAGSFFLGRVLTPLFLYLFGFGLENNYLPPFPPLFNRLLPFCDTIVLKFRVADGLSLPLLLSKHTKVAVKKSLSIYRKGNFMS